MKNVFCELHVLGQNSHAAEGDAVDVNMSRVQEMYSHRGGTKLVMNIPGYVITVNETRQAIKEQLRKINLETATEIT